VLAFVLATAIGSFAATSWALGSNSPPQLRANLPARDLPTSSLGSAEATTINNLIGEVGVSAYGITADSYARVRVLKRTSLGTMYLISGSRGACLVLNSASSCGDPGASGQPMLALVRYDALRDELVGGGIVTDTAHTVTLDVAGKKIATSVNQGIFSVAAHLQLRPGVGIRFSLR
jgi:hypothetical protein